MSPFSSAQTVSADWGARVNSSRNRDNNKESNNNDKDTFALPKKPTLKFKKIDFDNTNNNKDPKDIEKEMMITRSTASKIIELMVQKGMIERTEVAYDARLKKLSLTDKAMERHAKIMEIGKMTYEKAMTGFSKEEEDILRGYINRIKENMFK